MTTSSHGGHLPRPAADASPALLAQLRRPRTALRPLREAEKREWAAFGSGATDRQRINLFLRDGDGHALFCHAGQLLGGGLPRAVEASGLALPANRIEALATAATGFLEAAESVLANHRTRLYLDPLRPGGDARVNGVVLEWKDRDPSRTATEAVPLDAFRAARWEGLARGRDPRYTQAVRGLMDHAGTLADAMRAIAVQLVEARLAVRTFEPERGGDVPRHGLALLPL